MTVGELITFLNDVSADTEVCIDEGLSRYGVSFIYLENGFVFLKEGKDYLEDD